MDPSVAPNPGRLRYWSKVILVPALAATLAGFLISYGFRPQYNSESLMQVEAASIPEAVMQPVFTEDLTQHIAILQQRVLSRSSLESMIKRLGVVESGQDIDDAVSDIRLNMTIRPVQTDPAAGGPGKKGSGEAPLRSFYVNYTATGARKAQEICDALTSLLLTEDSKARDIVTESTRHFLTGQLESAKQKLDDLDTKVGAFKGQHVPTSLSIEYNDAQNVYRDLLAKLNYVELAGKADLQEQGERMVLLYPASVPDTPDFPNRLLMAGGGLIAGLAFGSVSHLWIRYKSKLSNSTSDSPHASLL